MLYGMYERLLSDYPQKLSTQQRNWINYAVKMLFKSSPAYIYYDNDDSILEEYKYLHYSSEIQHILLNSANEYPKLIAAIAFGRCMNVTSNALERCFRVIKE